MRSKHMDGNPEPQSANPIPVDDPLIQSGVRFLQALFDEKDTILFRPIETWIEGGKKQSRVLYKQTIYRIVHPLLLPIALQQLHQTSAAHNANVFFGVCPRKGSNGRFDLAWQIRTVRALWTDIDHVTVDEARERVTKAGLPPPSIIVSSGYGVHLYWLLDQPYLIDDAGYPPAVENEWVKSPDGRKKPPRKYILENGEKVYLDARRHVSRLSDKAQHCQDVLAGIAKVVGGDHTTDLARLLRIPGTFNRKDQRNGRQPVLTVLVECEPTHRYQFSDFERLAITSPDTERTKKIAVMPLPQVRKLSTARGNKLAELVAACTIAPPGTRSETDFSLCCYAIKNGIDKEQVWGQVESIGKFAEQGRRYFETTWGAAEFEVRSNLFEKLSPRVPAVASLSELTTDCDGTVGGTVPSMADDAAGGDERPTIHVDPATTPVGETLRRVTDCLIEAKNCFIRCEQLVVVHGDSIASILSPQELAGLLNQHVEFFFVDEDEGEFRPLTTAYGSTWLNQRAERARMPQIKLFTRNPVYTDDWRIVAPGYDIASGIYYCGQSIVPCQETPHLNALLQDFCFKSPADRTNYLGMLLTALLIPRFIGAKPAALFNGNQPGLGKSILAQIIAILRDGHPTETASYNSNDEEFEKRLGSIVRRGVTTIVIDNAKGHGRKARIESACLERSVTDPVLSFRLLGKSQEIRAENSHIFCVTANTPDVSPDLVSRSVVINLQHEGDPKRRTFHVDDPEGYAEQHRMELLSELLGMVERWKAVGMPMANVNTRFNKRGWGNIIGGILEANGEPDFLANAEEAAAQLDETRREFTELVAILVDHQQGNWSATELAELCNDEGLLTGDLGEGTPRSLSTKMGTLAGRYINERFDMIDGRRVAFLRESGRKGNLYRVIVIDEVPNLEGFAEPLPNLCEPTGSAP